MCGYPNTTLPPVPVTTKKTTQAPPSIITTPNTDKPEPIKPPKGKNESRNYLCSFIHFRLRKYMLKPRGEYYNKVNDNKMIIKIIKKIEYSLTRKIHLEKLYYLN